MEGFRCLYPAGGSTHDHTHRDIDADSLPDIYEYARENGDGNPGPDFHKDPSFDRHISLDPHSGIHFHKDTDAHLLPVCIANNHHSPWNKGGNTVPDTDQNVLSQRGHYSFTQIHTDPLPRTNPDGDSHRDIHALADTHLDSYTHENPYAYGNAAANCHRDTLNRQGGRLLHGQIKTSIRYASL
jgi:hypothetical protein